ncbi:MAG TPA: gamma-glutamylcyclotransferase [bacterium]|nr:gamma-glutamylcyclotransferase [bacterium]
MELNQPRVFVYGSLMRNLQNLHKIESGFFLSRQEASPFYVMLYASLAESDVVYRVQQLLQQNELYELGDDDTDLIEQLESHPDFFHRSVIQLEDGTQAVAYDLANANLYTIQRVVDESDWQMVMRTYDPTWMIGPSLAHKLIPKRTLPKAK